jgi:hypothetical protein
VPRGQPVTAENRAHVLQLHGEGLGRNAIAKRVGISTAAVSAVVHAVGLDFARRDSVVATEARLLDLKARRADLAERLVVKAGQLLDRMDMPYEVHAFGAGRDERYELRTGIVSRPPAADEAKLMTSLGIAVQRSMELDRMDSDGGQAAAVSVVDGLMAAFAGAVRLLDLPAEVTEP